MKTSEDIKKMVADKYSEIANQSQTENANSCCGVGGCGTVDYAVFAEDYSALEGYQSDADLGLGCGLPTAFAKIKTGDKVLDLGSGAGNDCFVAREIVGESGKVIGIDMTDAMIEKARTNADKLGFNNVEFRKGDIENLPIGGNSIDVVVSNCVLNLVPDKNKAFQETFRVLKPGGHFSVSDVVLKGNLPEKLKNDAEMYAGCVSGAIQLDEYLRIIKNAGFSNITVQKERSIVLPKEIVAQYLSEEALVKYYDSPDFGIYSVTVYAEKAESCCDPSSNCC
ncbi:MAG: arsenite methyltransferase [Vicingaceae bacterium]|nr:arsenite methyltransferase [Vicingaceae bacterium]